MNSPKTVRKHALSFGIELDAKLAISAAFPQTAVCLLLFAACEVTIRLDGHLTTISEEHHGLLGPQGLTQLTTNTIYFDLPEGARSFFHVAVLCVRHVEKERAPFFAR